MNFYNPYYIPMTANFIQPKVGLFGKLFGNSSVTIGGFINGTQKILNIANQTIPLVKQVKPMIGNAKTMFKVMNEFKRTEKQSQNKINLEEKNTEFIDANESKITSSKQTNQGPTFFA